MLRKAEEIDSFLYQTVGQDAIEYIAQALDVPLYRAVIKGTAITQDLVYGARLPGQSAGVQGDETEDLFNLLSTVKVIKHVSALLYSSYVGQSSSYKRCFCWRDPLKLPEITS